MTNYLVTGGCGFIGSAFLRRFVPQCPNDRFLNVDLLTYAGNKMNVAAVSAARNYASAWADVADMQSMDRLFASFSPDVVVHFAAESHVDRSIDGPAPFLRTNVEGTFVLLECCRKYWGAARYDKRFHQVSTDEVYGSMGFDDAPKKETDAYDPSSPYSASKAAADHLVRAWGRTFDLHYTISIACNNYGPYQMPEKLIPRMICRAMKRESLPVFGDGKNRREWIHVDDHVDAIMAILMDSVTRRTYNVGSGYEVANIDLVEAICKRLALGDRIKYDDFLALISFVSDRPGHDRRYALSSERLVNSLSGTLLGRDNRLGSCNPPVKVAPVAPQDSQSLRALSLGVRRRPGWGRNLSDGLDDTVAWYLANPDWIEAAQSGSYR